MFAGNYVIVMSLLAIIIFPFWFAIQNLCVIAYSNGVPVQDEHYGVSMYVLLVTGIII